MLSEAKLKSDAIDNIILTVSTGNPSCHKHEMCVFFCETYTNFIMFSAYSVFRCPVPYAINLKFYAKLLLTCQHPCYRKSINYVKTTAKTNRNI